MSKTSSRSHEERRVAAIGALSAERERSAVQRQLWSSLPRMLWVQEQRKRELGKKGLLCPHLPLFLRDWALS